MGDFSSLGELGSTTAEIKVAVLAFFKNCSSICIKDIKEINGIASFED
jgi:hypothetical protein